MLEIGAFIPQSLIMFLTLLRCCFPHRLLISICLGSCVSVSGMTDSMEDWSKVLNHSPNLRIIAKDVDWIPSVDSRVIRNRPGDAEIVYSVDGIQDFAVTVYRFGGGGKPIEEDRLLLLVSTDNKSFSLVDYKVSSSKRMLKKKDWYEQKLTPAGQLPEGIQLFKVFLPHVEKDRWWPLVTEIQFGNAEADDGFKPIVLD